MRRPTAGRFGNAESRSLAASLLAGVRAGGQLRPGVVVRSMTLRTRSEVVLARAAERVRVWLAPPLEEEESFARSAHLAIGHQGAWSDAAALAEAMDALFRLANGRAARLDERTRRAWFARAALRRILRVTPRLEWLAVADGLKPASRHALTVTDASQWARQADELGLVSVRLEAASFVSRWTEAGAVGADTLLYVARDRALAERARDAEAAALVAGATATRPELEPLGAALGYPACCVAAFRARPGASNAELRAQAARATTRGEAPWFMASREDGLGMLSHLPCRFDCAQSVLYARRLVETLGDIAPEEVRALATALPRELRFVAEGQDVVVRFGVHHEAPSHPAPLRAVLVRGGGDLGTGAAVAIARARLPVIVVDLPLPTALRLTVAFASAVLDGAVVVGGVRAVHARSEAEVRELLERGEVALWTGSEAELGAFVTPLALVDARMRGLSARDLSPALAPLVIALGPGFTAGLDCHLIVETNRGASLGDVIASGQASSHTGTPGQVEGLTHERLLRAPVDGTLTRIKSIGDLVEAGDVVAEVEGLPVKSLISGMIRGLKLSGLPVRAGWKVGDVDPRRDRALLAATSDKAARVGAGVLAALRRGGVDTPREE